MTRQTSRFLTAIHPTSFPAALLAMAFLTSPANGADYKLPDPVFTHPKEITNPYFPIGTLEQDILVSKDERVERTAKPGIDKSILWHGKEIHALVVEDREVVDGKLEEVALDYFAQSDDGTVYYLGEDVDEYKDGKVSGHSGAWVAGQGLADSRCPYPGETQGGG